MNQLKIAAAVILALFTHIALAQTPKPDFVPGEFLVKLKSSQDLSVGYSDQLQAEVLRSLEKQNIFVIKRPLVEQSAFSLESLRNNPIVEKAEPNFYYYTQKTATDTNYSLLWGLRNFGQSDNKQVGVSGVDIGAEDAWDITTGSDSVVVAVIDTGIDLNHPDLKSNLWINTVEANGRAGVDDDGNGFIDDINGVNFVEANIPTSNPHDDNGHGTHCAGTIGAVSNKDGIVGVAWKVKLMPVKFLGGSGGGTLEGAIRSIDYAVKMGAHILSNSWGGGGSSQLLQEAIERAEKAGTLFVAAAGNSGMNNDTSPHYPSSYPVNNVLSVADIDNRGEVAGFSNTGKKSVSVAAPGVNIYSTYLNGGYEWLSGTSMATPHVSGLAALLLAQAPKRSYQEIKDRIMTTARKLPTLRNRVSSGGLVNARNALLNFQPPPDPNDPFFWNSKEVNLTNSAHPYLPNTREEFEVELNGASEFSILFDRFETERGYDKVSFIDRTGALLFELNGIKDDSFSPTIKGSYVKIIFTSDGSVEKFGFSASRVYFR
jgi:thermitase